MVIAVLGRCLLDYRSRGSQFWKSCVFLGPLPVCCHTYVADSRLYPGRSNRWDIILHTTTVLRIAQSKGIPNGGLWPELMNYFIAIDKVSHGDALSNDQRPLPKAFDNYSHWTIHFCD